jgi:predicted homoserine dehydrogenase-like protein
VRGIAVNIKENKNHVPIGLLEDITLSRDVKAGERITFDDIVMPNNRAVEIWKEIIKTI